MKRILQKFYKTNLITLYTGAILGPFVGIYDDYRCKMKMLEEYKNGERMSYQNLDFLNSGMTGFMGGVVIGGVLPTAVLSSPLWGPMYFNFSKKEKDIFERK